MDYKITTSELDFSNKVAYKKSKSIMQKKSLNILAFFVISYAFILSAFALAGYILHYFDWRINTLNMLFVVLTIAIIIYIACPITISRPNKTDLLIASIALLASARFAIFFISNYPVGSSVDIAHYYFATDWIQTNSNMDFFDYTKSPDYYYLWHTWSLWLWYYGFEFASAFVSNILGINVLKSMQIITGMSGVVSILCMGLIGNKILDAKYGGILTMLQLAAMPATFLLVYNGFFANLTGLSIGLVLAYVSIDKVNLNRLPVIFVLIAGGFLMHIHIMVFMLIPILLYKIMAYSKLHAGETTGFILTACFAFITTYMLNPLVFNKFLFESTQYIIIDSGKKSLYDIPFLGFDNLFGHGIFLIIGIIGTLILYRNYSKTSLYQIIWFTTFIGGFLFLLGNEKLHWANRMGYIVVYPLAISCAALYMKLLNVNIMLKNRYIRNIYLTAIIIALMLTSVYLDVSRTDLNPVIYDIGIKLRGIDKDSTIAHIEYPEYPINPNKFFISAFSKHRIAWPQTKSNRLTYNIMNNTSYTNDYIPAWTGYTPDEYTTYNNFDSPEHILVMFSESSKNHIYYLFDTDQFSTTTCQNVVSNHKSNNCSIYMDFINDENILLISGFYEYESINGRWAAGKPEVMIPTIEQNGGILRIVSGAFRPEGPGEASVDVYLNDVLIGNFTAGNDYTTNTFELNSNIVSKPFSVITFNTTTWIPDEWIGNGDLREIGIKFSSIEFIKD